MDLITTSVYFGVASIIVMFSFNILHCILAGIFGVRIEKFGMLLAIGNTHFLKFKRNHIEYSLGWIPVSGYVGISGMTKEQIEGVELQEYMLYAKSPIVRFICTAGAPLLLLILFIISALFIDPNGGLTEGFQVLNNVIYNIYQYVIGAIDIPQTEATWKTISNTYHEFPIILCLMTLFTALTSIITLLTNTLSEKIQTLYNVASIALFIFYLYILYKIGRLYFVANGFIDGLLAICKFAVTTIIISFAIFLLIKILPKNKYL